MISESDLNDTERKVLAAFRAGDAEVNVARAKVRGDFLRGLFLGGYDEKADYRGTCIVDAVINDVLNLEFCDARFPVRFRDCLFAQEIKLQQLICPELRFSGCTLKNGMDALSAKVAGGVNLTKANAMGRVRLAGADIGGQLVCTGGSFRNKEGDALNAQGIKVAEDVLLKSDDSNSKHVKEFKSEGKVSLAGAKIGGQLNCTDGRFQNRERVALNAQGITVAGTVFLHRKFKADGAVSLVGADIDGQLNCRGGNFQNERKSALNARNIKVANEIFIHNLSSTGRTSFANATIGGNFKLNNCKLTHLSLAGANVFGELQDNVKAYKDNQGRYIDMNIDGFRYHRLGAAQKQVEDRIEWAGSMSKGDKFYPQPYEQLMQVYRATGHTNWARDVGFALEEKRHEVMESWWWRVWYRVLRATIGYGYKPFRAITHWFIPLIVAGFVLFSGMLPCPDPYRAESESCHCMAPSDAEVLLSEDWKIHGKLPKDYPDFNPYYYAVETALPVLPLGQTENWHPKIPWVRLAQGLITIIGALVLTILASYGVGVLGPRWKNE